jgi:hypothetical protein
MSDEKVSPSLHSPFDPKLELTFIVPNYEKKKQKSDFTFEELSNCRVASAERTEFDRWKNQFEQFATQDDTSTKLVLDHPTTIPSIIRCSELSVFFGY